jgi:hypothetical protein
MFHPHDADLSQVAANDGFASNQRSGRDQTEKQNIHVIKLKNRISSALSFINKIKMKNILVMDATTTRQGFVKV